MWLCENYNGLEIDIVRDTFTALKSTVWKDFKQVLVNHNLYHPANHNKTDHIYNLNGNLINYYGADDPAKIHGRARDFLWINESNQLDEETIDEEFYDEKAVSRFIDFILLHTEKNALFQTIYYKAANQMLSENYGIGITILLSYDYLFDFHVCLVDYFQNKNEFESSNPNYQKLLTLL